MELKRGFITKFLIILIIATTYQSVIANNVDPTSCFQIKPKKSSVDFSYHFGASLKMQSVEEKFLLHVGAPYYKPMDQAMTSNQPIKNGSVYQCIINQRQREQTCESIRTFEKNGAIGMSLEINQAGNAVVVCGNQYMYECPNANVIQRLVGSCYSYQYASEYTRELKSPCETECPQNKLIADIVFALDGSGSVESENFKTMLKWVETVLSSFKKDIDNGNVWIGIIVFTENSCIEVELAAYAYDDLVGKINRIEFPGGGTDIAEAIILATKILENTKRLNVAKEVIVITDGQSNVPGTSNAAKEARKKGITTVAVGVGRGTNNNVLSAIAGKSNRIFRASDFNNLQTVVDGLRTVIKDSASTTLEGQNTNSTNNLTQCQAGTSAYITTKNNLYVGAVGSYDRAGSLISFAATNDGLLQRNYLKEKIIKLLIHPENFVNFKESYLGYSVVAGKFNGGTQAYIASGAPRYLSKGVVIIYNPELATYPTSSNYLLHPHNSSSLWQLGSYFGQSLCSIDLNNDTLDDLLVSAPLYSDVSGYDQGRVFVFMNDPAKPGLQGWLLNGFLPKILSGANAVGARFGMSVVVGGDIDQNGYDDIIVGAPHEGATSSESGAVYIYYANKNGISELNKQKILGRSLPTSMKGFGMSVLQGSLQNYDLDNNNYPDVVASAPSSDIVTVIFSKPVVVVSAEIILESPYIDVPNCLSQTNKSCTSFQVCFSAYQRRNSDITTFDMSITILLDSLVSINQNKRLVFHGQTTSAKQFSQVITTTKQCSNYNVDINRNLFAKVTSSKTLAIKPNVRVSYDFSTNHQKKILSPVLDSFVPRNLSKSWNFSTSCNGTGGKCVIDLVANAQYSIPPSNTAYVLKTRPGIFEVNITAVNLGPDSSLFVGIHVFSGQLSFSKIIGNCVQLLDSANNVLTFGMKPSRVYSAYAFFKPNTPCNFIVQYPLQPLASGGKISAIFINGSIYSSLGDVIGSDSNPKNNNFQYKRDIRYKATLFITRNAIPSTLSYNRLLSPVVASAIQDPVLGGNNTNINHSYVVTNSGPHGISKAKLTFSWYSSILANGSFPLLYLYDFQCWPSSICKCNVVGNINRLNLSLSNQLSTIILLEFPSYNQFPSQMNCKSIHCKAITCYLTNFLPNKQVHVKATFKLWTPSFSQPGQVDMSSSINVDLSKSLTDKSLPQTYKMMATTVVSAYQTPVATTQTSSNIWAVIAAALGGVAFLAITTLILWKAGFFQSKYGSMLKDAQENEGAIPPGRGSKKYGELKESADAPTAPDAQTTSDAPKGNT